MAIKMKYKICLLVIITFLPILVSAQVKDTISSAAKIDSIYNLQKKMYAESKNNPLANKKFGIEVNLLRLLLIDKAVSISGSFSLFSINRHAEISFPFYYQHPEKSTDLSEFTLDCHYRYFMGNTQNGFYLSGFARYAFLQGTLGNNDLFNTQQDGPKDTENKLGLGIGFGYRIFSYRGLYWGVSLSLGRYLIGESNKFSGGFLSLDDDNEFIFDMELLKFGWSF